MGIRTGRIAVAALAATCVFSVVSCSDNSSSEAGSTTSIAPGVLATGDPIKVGLFNPSKGPATQAGVTTGKNAAIEYINNQIGGINGRPIEVIDCGIDNTSPESTISCANQFVQAGVVAAVDGYNAESAAAMPILTSAEIPLVGQIPFNTATGAVPENRVFFGPPPAAFLVGFLQSLKQAGKDSLTLVNADLPQAHQVFDSLLTPLGQQLGIDVKSAYYPPAGPNFTALASTIADGSPAAGGLMTAPNDNTCNKLAQALKSVKYSGTVFLAACTEFVDVLGAQAVGAQSYSPVWLPPAIDSAPEPAKSNLRTAEQFIDNAGGTAGFYAYGTFATFVDLARALTSAPPAEFTGPAILTALKGLADYQSFLGPKLNCGKATSPNCTTDMLLFEVTGDKKTAPVSGGFITPNPEVLKLIPGAA
ncbi:ABC transporter substrate-binding protein [Nocardia mangyaensis]|uniref:ABC transporter substrate-binding protein n=1 Tax=Nocardia mangyaensis TaxID=2213200 RepID=UPI000AFDF9DE|nr:ABC transporter substrate-binding protein [Nocardia mangyaensis]